MRREWHVDRCGPDDVIALKQHDKRGGAIYKSGQRKRIDLSYARDKSDKCCLLRR